MQALKKDTKKLGRLKDRSDFLRVRQSDRSWVSKGFVLQIANKPETENAPYTISYGVTATKKLSPLAVKRNRAKRRLRACATDILPFYACDGYDFVLIARQDIFTRPYDVLKKDLKWCLKKLDCFMEQEV